MLANIVSKQLIICALGLLLCGCLGPRLCVPDGTPPPTCNCSMPQNIRVALVLGSGGIRGTAHVGVLEEFENAGIHFDLIVGCSAGSIVGALYADHPDSEYIKEAVFKLRTNSLLDIDLLHCRYGVSQGRTMRRLLGQYLSAEYFEQLQIPLVVVASDLNSGELVPIGNGHLIKAVQASCSIPFIFIPIEHHGRILIDGGVIDPVPVRVARDLGAEIVIAVDLCELLPTTFPTNLFQVAKRSAEIAFLWQNDSCNHDADIIIRPSMCDIGTFNDKMKLEIYEAGKSAAREAIPRIRKIFAEHGIEQCQCCWQHHLEANPEKIMVELKAYTP